MQANGRRRVGFYWTPVNGRLEDELDLFLNTGARTVCLPHSAIDQIPIAELRRNGVTVLLDWSCFVGEHWQKQYPDCVPITADGDEFLRDDWYVPVCPNHPQVRERHLAGIAELLDTHGDQIDGLWLDFIRYPVRWEKDQPVLRQVCFCRHCLNLFLEESREQYSKGRTRAIAQDILAQRPEAWVGFKCERIADFVATVRSEIAARKLTLRLGMFSLPWRRFDYDGAIRSIAGQDLVLLADYVDHFSPMVYHKLCHRRSEWIADVIHDVEDWAPRTVLPIIQSVDRPDTMLASELDSALMQALNAANGSVLIFTQVPVLENAGKRAVVANRFRKSPP